MKTAFFCNDNPKLLHKNTPKAYKNIILVTPLMLSDSK